MSLLFENRPNVLYGDTAKSRSDLSRMKGSVTGLKARPKSDRNCVVVFEEEEKNLGGVKDRCSVHLGPSHRLHAHQAGL